MDTLGIINKKGRKKQILKEAAKIFSKKGYWKTDIDSIAQKLQLGKGTIYRYFENKEDIFISLLDAILDQLIETLKKQSEKHEDFFEKIYQWVYIYMEFFEKNYVYFNVITQENPGLKAKIFGNFWKKLFDKGIDIENDFSSAAKKGIIKNISSKEGIFILTGMIHGLIHHWGLSNRKYSLKNKSKFISETFLKGIAKNGTKNKRTYKLKNKTT